MKFEEKTISTAVVGILLISLIFILDANAQPVFGIDTSNLVDPRVQSSSTAITLTTNKAPEIIGVCITTTNWYAGSSFAPPYVKTVKDTANLSWKLRGAAVYWHAGLVSWRVEEWTALSSTILSSDTITTTLQYNSYTDVVAFGIVGFNTTKPFDVSAAASSAGWGASASATISTTAPNDMVVGCTAIGGAIAYGSGLVGIQNTGTCPGNGNGDQCAPFQGLAAEYQMEPTPQSNIHVTFTDTTEVGSWAVVADVVVQTTSSTSTTTSTSTASTTSPLIMKVLPNVNVPARATTLTVTLGTAEPDTNYAVSVSPSWNTVVWVTGKTSIGFTLSFSAAPSQNSSVDITVIHP
jgi:hypothetical protein